MRWGLLVLLMLLAATPAAAVTVAPAYTDSAADPVDTPIYVTAPPGDSHRLFVVERGGRIRVAVDGVIRDTPFLDISSEVSTAGESGLLSMAFASDYATSKKFYVYFGGTDSHIHIEQFLRSAADPNVADKTSELGLLDISHTTHTNHWGGQLQWGSDNKLYAGTGDGGGSYDADHNAQNAASYLGKLLRIDPATPGTATVVAMGLRNPWRWSFDRANGDAVIGDVGQDSQEEIDWLPFASLSGTNFGWPCYEGTIHWDARCNPPGSTPAGYVGPVYTYDTSSAPSVAITGGVVVRDPALTELYGRYVYADSFAGQTHSQVLATPTSTDDRIEPLPKIDQIVNYGEDADGRVYVVSLFGPVYRLVHTGDSGGGTTTTPAPTPTAPTPTTETPAPTPTTTTSDRTPPRLTLRYRKVQRVGHGVRLRIAVGANEQCFVRFSARQINRGLVLVKPGFASTANLRPNRRLHRGKSKVRVLVRARDAAGNVTEKTVTIRVLR